MEIGPSSRYYTEGEPREMEMLSARSHPLTDQVRDREDELRRVGTFLMSEAAVKQGSERQSAPQFGEAEERELRRLFGQWREGAGLGANEENQFAHMLKALVASRAAELLESDAFILLMRSFTGGAEFSADESQDLVRQVKPLLRVRVLTEQEKKELAQLFDRYHMRLWSKLGPGHRCHVGSQIRTLRRPSGGLHPRHDALVRPAR